MPAFLTRVLSYWRTAASFIAAVLVPYLLGQARDKIVGDAADLTWRSFDFPDRIANIWIWLETNPLFAAAYATLAWLCLAAFRAQQLDTQPSQNRTLWLECERGFAEILGEVGAISQINADGLVRWSVHPMGVRGSTGDERDVDRFLAEARHAGGLLAAMPAIPRRFENPRTIDLADDWLNVVTALVRFPRAWTGDGYNADDIQFGAYTTIGFDDLVRSSRDACRAIASGHARSVLETSQRTAAPKPDRTSFGESTNLDDLRRRAQELGGIEHVSDADTVPITSYPSLVEPVLFPSGVRPSTRITLSPGQSLDLRFKDPLIGFAFSFQQGLYPGNFNIYYRDGTQRVLVAPHYPPQTNFIGEASQRLIDRIVLQTQLAGNISVDAVHLFPRNRHERVLPK